MKTMPRIPRYWLGTFSTASALQITWRFGDFPQPNFGEEVETPSDRTSKTSGDFSSKSTLGGAWVKEEGRRSVLPLEKSRTAANLGERPIYSRKSRRTRNRILLRVPFYLFCTLQVRSALICRLKCSPRRDWSARIACTACRCVAIVGLNQICDLIRPRHPRTRLTRCAARSELSRAWLAAHSCMRSPLRTPRATHSDVHVRVTHGGLRPWFWLAARSCVRFLCALHDPLGLNWPSKASFNKKKQIFSK